MDGVVSTGGGQAVGGRNGGAGGHGGLTWARFGMNPRLMRFTARKNFVYTPDHWPRPLQADLYQPRGEGPFAGVLLVYGGSWSAHDHRWHMRHVARRLARRGLIAVIASYRGCPDFLYPAPLEDLREALRWMRRHAAEWRLSPDRIGTYGFSAGGHLAALLGTTAAGNGSPPVAAIVAASAPHDLTLYPEAEIPPRFLGTTYARNPALFREASPLFHVKPSTPPCFLYHGTADTVVSPEHSRLFKSALDHAGVRGELHWLRGRGHAMTLILGGAAERAAVDFLATTLGA